MPGAAAQAVGTAVGCHSDLARAITMTCMPLSQQNKFAVPVTPTRSSALQLRDRSSVQGLTTALQGCCLAVPFPAPDRTSPRQSGPYQPFAPVTARPHLCSFRLLPGACTFLPQHVGRFTHQPLSTTPWLHLSAPSRLPNALRDLCENIKSLELPDGKPDRR